MKWALAILFFTTHALASLQSLVALSRTTSPVLQSHLAQREAIEATAAGAVALPPPALGVEWGNKGNGMYYTGASVGQIFLHPGKRNASRQVAQSRTRLARATEQDQIRLETANIAVTYIELYKIQNNQEWSDSALTASRALRESLTRSYGKALVGQEAILLVDARIARLRGDSLKLVSEKSTLLYTLLAQVADSQARQMIPKRIAFADTLSLPKSETITQGATQRPDLQALNAATALATQESEVARLQKYPDWMITGHYMSMLGMGPDEWGLMLGVSVPIAPWAQIQTQASANASRAQIRASQAMQTARTVQVQKEIQTAQVGLQTAQDRYTLAQNEGLNVAQKALEANYLAFAAGRTELSMVLEAQSMLWLARNDAIEAKVNWLLAAIAYAISTGLNPEDIIVEIDGNARSLHVES